METLLILVLAAGLPAAAVWWALSRAPGRGDDGRLVGFGPQGADAFVFSPSDSTPVPDDRPPRSISLARLSVAVAISTVVLVAAVWVLGLLVKVQLDRYFLSGR